MSKRAPDIAQLRRVLEAYELAGRSKRRAASDLGLSRSWYIELLDRARRELGEQETELIIQGAIESRRVPVCELPQSGGVRRYILTSAQNNTHLHPGWINLKAYADYLDKLPRCSCEFIVGTFQYCLDELGAKLSKREAKRTSPKRRWYPPEIREFIRDEPVELAPKLIWCGEMNILPTVKYPLNGLEAYNGTSSNIVPHAKICLESVPVLRTEGVKLNFSTGTITQRNYIQRRTGIISEQAHCYGGLLVEVDDAGNWFVRQLHIDGSGHVYDLGPSPDLPVRIVDGRVSEGARVEAITWGDIHAAEMDADVRRTCWDEGGVLDMTYPRRQFMHDVFSMRSRSPHETKNFHAMYSKHIRGVESVEAEVKTTADFINQAERPWCQTIIVSSNHDRHLERWLNETDLRKDLQNAEYHAKLQVMMLDRARTCGILEAALRDAGLSKSTLFLQPDESYKICRDTGGGIECGLHGDRGPGGARGSTAALLKLGRPINKGHDHTATIRGEVYSAGSCSLDYEYQEGPTSQSVSHIVTFENGKRQVITMWRGKWRA